MWVLTGTIVIILIPTAAYVFRKCLERFWGKVDPADEEDVTGKVIIVTGANAGNISVNNFK